MNFSHYRFPRLDQLTLEQMRLAIGIARNILPDKQPPALGFYENDGFFIDLESHPLGIFLSYSPTKFRIIDVKNPMQQVAIDLKDGSAAYQINLGSLGQVKLEACLLITREETQVIISQPEFTSKEADFFKAQFYFSRGVDHQGKASPAPTLIVDTSRISQEDIEGLYTSAESLLEFWALHEKNKEMILLTEIPILIQWELMLRDKYCSSN